ncbi:MAG: UDP-N-acetylmuramate--L-alanine ligase [Cyanobacteria bacterium P01_H01_bin.130]
MLNPVDFGGRPFHFIGVGGIGMSALAYVLTQRSLPVSGSDLRENRLTQRLEGMGARFFLGQTADNIRALVSGKDPAAEAESLPQVVCSTAIPKENPEFQAAIAAGCPIFHRSDILAGIMTQYRGIAIAGTHGKTTTSSALGQTLLHVGLDPTAIVGGEVPEWGGNAHLGESDWLVAEADESDGSLVKLTAEIGVITNIELDHPDHYDSLESVIGIFRTFEGNCKTLVASLDCPTVRSHFQPDITYSLSRDSGATYTADAIELGGQGAAADVYENGDRLGRLQLQLLGEHNLSNALAVVAVGRQLGVEFAALAAGLGTFSGAKRRFEHRGSAGEIEFYDDYAHHPSEIRVTLAAARQRLQTLATAAGQAQRVVAVFQPHRFSRVAAFLDEFATAFADAHQVIVTDVYAAGEKNTAGLDGAAVAEAIATHHPAVTYQGELSAVVTGLVELLQPGDLVIFLGAGNLNQVIPTVLEQVA